MASLLRNLAAGLLAAALAWATPAGAQTPPPASSQELGAFAAKEFAARRYDAALKAAEDRLRADRRDGRAAFVRAASLTRLGRGADAAAAFERYAKAGGKHRELDREWGLALMVAGKPAEAQAKFVSFLRANPDRKDSNLLIGLSAMLAWKFADSRAALKTAYESEALRPQALVLLTALAGKWRRPGEAYLYLMELLAKYPGTLEAVTLAALIKSRAPDSMWPDGAK